MAKKSASKDAARLKAQQMREAQARADRRTRNIIIAVVAVVVLAVVAVVGVVITEQMKKDSEARSADASLLGKYTEGTPVLLSSSGVGTADESVPTLTEYFDYSCHACADIDGYIGQSVSKGALNGEYNVEYVPVANVNMAYATPATSASLMVADQDPDHWVAFHHALLAYFGGQYNSGNGTVIQDEDASWEQVKVIASEVGIAQDLIDKFPLNAAEDYLKASTAAWREGSWENHESAEGTIGTPEFVLNGEKKITLSGKDASTILASLRSAMGLSTSASTDGAQSE